MIKEVKQKINGSCKRAPICCGKPMKMIIPDSFYFDMTFQCNKCGGYIKLDK